MECVVFPRSGTVQHVGTGDPGTDVFVGDVHSKMDEQDGWDAAVSTAQHAALRNLKRFYPIQPMILGACVYFKIWDLPKTLKHLLISLCGCLELLIPSRCLIPQM